MQARRNVGGMRGVVISHVDITQRKLAEESIADSEARLVGGAGRRADGPVGVDVRRTPRCGTPPNTSCWG
jgi:hypothetical protein